MYYIWRVCERLGLNPPDIEKNWDDNDQDTQAMLLAYEEGRQKEDFDVASLGLLKDVQSQI